MGHLTLPPFTVAKPGIMLPSPTGTSFIGIFQCSITQSRALTFQLIWFIAIMAHT